ncbi:hypothetical protein D3C71_18940 [compost metagenome]
MSTAQESQDPGPAIDTHDMQDMQGWVLRVASAKSQLAQARARLHAAEARKTRTWVSRLRSWLTTSPEQAAYAAAHEHAQATMADAQHFARDLVGALAKAALQADSAAFARWHVARERLERVNTAGAQARQLAQLARDAHAAVLAARDACASASTMEFVDLCSTNKAISALSFMETSDAADAVRRANEAMQRLQAAVPSAHAAQVDVPDDTFDLVVDFAVDFGFDFLSFFNMGKLDAATEECDRILAKLSPAVLRLAEASRQADVTSSAAAHAVRDIELPFLRDALARVPPEFELSLSEDIVVAA